MDIIQQLIAALKQFQPLTEVEIGVDEVDFKIVSGKIANCDCDLQITVDAESVTCVVNHNQKEIAFLSNDELIVNTVNYCHPVNKSELLSALSNYVFNIITK